MLKQMPQVICAWILLDESERSGSAEGSSNTIFCVSSHGSAPSSISAPCSGTRLSVKVKVRAGSPNTRAITSPECNMIDFPFPTFFSLIKTPFVLVSIQVIADSKHDASLL
jgi:hypothetical protein